MWIFASSGFVSAVEHRDNHDMLMVRARDRKSLEFMISSIELAGAALPEDGSEGVVDKDLKIVSSPSGDYRHRVVVSKATFALYLQFEVNNYLRYPNFKSELAKVRKEPEFSRAAHRVWDDMQLVSDGVQVYGSVGKGGTRIKQAWKDYPAAKGAGKKPEAGAVGSTFFDDVEEEHGAFLEEYDAVDDEGLWEALPEGSESWTDEEFEAYLAEKFPSVNLNEPVGDAFTELPEEKPVAKTARKRSRAKK